jgi:hypothetical protein
MRRTALAVLSALVAGCVHPTQFDRYYTSAQWTDAARAFDADSSLITNERTLYRGALVYGTPGRPTYNPLRGRQLLQVLLLRFPSTSYRDDAESRLLFLNEVIRTRDEAARHERELEARIAELSRRERELRTRADTSVAQSDSLRSAVARLEAERREREEQLRVLRLELQQLKEIDLKSRPPVKPIKPY